VLATRPSWCGVCSEGASTEPRHELRVLAGYSPNSPTVIGTATGRELATAEVSYSYRCWSWPHVSLSYTAGMMPAVVLRQPEQLELGFLLAQEIPAHAVYGFAVIPVGFLAEFARRRRLHPIAELNGGIIASTEPIPERGLNATGLNFIFDIGGGVRWNVSGTAAVTVGYRFLHISNANTTSFNPGLDNNVLYASYSFLWR
jgi:hypothetical protein